MMILVTGGSGSGKSAYAEERILSMGQGRRIYVATMFPYDEESHRRIHRHRRMRAGKGFETVEHYTDLEELYLPSDGVILLECMSNLTANEMFREDKKSEDHVQKKILKGVRQVKEQVKHLVVVTNEIFSDGESYSKETRAYQENLGKINQAMADMADEVVEVVAGIPVFHKRSEERKP